MIHLPTALGGTVTHLVPRDAFVPAGTLLARVTPVPAGAEEICAPFDARVAIQRLHGRHAPPHARVIGLVRVLLASCDGRVQWIQRLGPVHLGAMAALVESPGGMRPHRTAGTGFIARLWAHPGQRVSAGMPLLELRGEEVD